MTPRFRRIATWVVLVACIALAVYGAVPALH